MPSILDEDIIGHNLIFNTVLLKKGLRRGLLHMGSEIGRLPLATLCTQTTFLRSSGAALASFKQGIGKEMLCCWDNECCL